MRKRTFWTVTLVLSSAAGVWACDAGEMMADAMVDTGAALMDAGGELRDAASSDARAQEPIAVGCDIERTRLIEYDSGGWNETTFWYAEVTNGSITPLSRPRVVLCDPEQFGDASEQLCDNPSLTCAGVNPTAPALRCRTAFGGEIEEGRFRIFCGSRTRAGSAPGEETSVSGSRWTSVEVTFD